MPTYDYRCEKCEHEFEAFQSITAAPLKKCPRCSKPRLKRLIGTGAALLFKGDGFYITDYRSESYKNAAKAESGTTAGETKAADGKTEAKPAEAKSPDSKTPAGQAAPKTEHKHARKPKK
jgi:putative FmdB family regulatory protein